MFGLRPNKPVKRTPLRAGIIYCPHFKKSKKRRLLFALRSAHLLFRPHIMLYKAVYLHCERCKTH